MQEIIDSMEKCIEIVRQYQGRLFIDEMYLSEKQWMLRVSCGEAGRREDGRNGGDIAENEEGEGGDTRCRMRM